MGAHRESEDDALFVTISIPASVTFSIEYYPEQVSDVTYGTLELTNEGVTIATTVGPTGTYVSYTSVVFDYT